MTKLRETPFILVVDGDEQTVDDEVLLLRGAGWPVLGTSDPWKALQLVAEATPSLILLDLDMPGIGGSDLRTTIQDDPGLRGIPVIYLSANAGLIGPRLEFFFGAVSCLPKPIDAAELIATVRRLLNKGSAPQVAAVPESIGKSGTRFVLRHRDPVSFERSA